MIWYIRIYNKKIDFIYFELLFVKGERGESIIGPKGDRGAPGLPGR